MRSFFYKWHFPILYKRGNSHSPFHPILQITLMAPGFIPPCKVRTRLSRPRIPPLSLPHLDLAHKFLQRHIRQQRKPQIDVLER